MKNFLLNISRCVIWAVFTVYAAYFLKISVTNVLASYLGLTLADDILKWTVACLNKRQVNFNGKTCAICCMPAKGYIERHSWPNSKIFFCLNHSNESYASLLEKLDDIRITK